MALVLKRMLKLVAYGFLLLLGFVLTVFVGRQGSEHKLTEGGVLGAQRAYADVPFVPGDGFGSDGGGGGGGGAGGAGGGGCGGAGGSDGDDGE